MVPGNSERTICQSGKLFSFVLSFVEEGCEQAGYLQVLAMCA